MLNVEWKARATFDLIDIVDYISQSNPAAAQQIYDVIRHSAEKLAEMPYCTVSISVR